MFLDYRCRHDRNEEKNGLVIVSTKTLYLQKVQAMFLQLRKIHFGQSPFYIGRSTGIGDCPVGMPTSEGQLVNPEMYKVSTSAIDRSELHLMYHGGVNMVTGNFSGIFEASV
jgi:hypothetical protein